ncbi:radical SAM protein [Enterococcus ratti]|nr:radical SAM protein [Enterococcus ratti]
MKLSYRKAVIKINNLISPSSLGIITTYKCTASCEDCCFSCSPNHKQMLSLEGIKKIIDEAAEFDSLSMIVWTGGEATLLRNNLLEGISYANSKNLKSRVISNAYWAKDIETAKEYLCKLKEAGMVELNVSTGDNHQQYISIDKVLNAVYASVSERLSTAITIELTKNSKFSQKNLESPPTFQRIKNEGLDKYLEILSSPWVSLKNDEKYKYDEIEDSEIENGCDNLFNYLAVDSYNRIYSCCGITVRRIKQLNIGNLKKDKLVESYQLQEKDILKKWLYVSGPIKIIHQVHKWNPEIVLPEFAHYCQFCDYIYNNKNVLQTISENISTIEPEINQMFSDKIEFNSLFK